MKKILSLVLVVVRLMSMTVTAFAASEQSGTSTVTAVVPAPPAEYTIHIPADMELVYGNGERQLVGKLSVTDVQNLSYWGFIDVIIRGTPLKSTEGNEIPVVFEVCYDGYEDYYNIVGNNLLVYEKKVDEYSTVDLYAQVTEEDWEAAKPGPYTSTITYTFRVVDF